MRKLAVQRRRRLQQPVSSTEDGAFSEEATPLAETLPSVAAGSTASTSATTTPFATAAAWHRERQNAAVDTQAGGSQRQGSAVDPARIATLSVRDALARALATGASDSDAPPPSGRPVVRTETASIKDPTTSDATPRTSGLIADGRLPATDAPAVTNGRVEPPQPQSEQVPATLAERVVESGDRGTADIEQGSAMLADAPADKAPRLDRIQANQPPAVAPAVDQQAPSAESSNATANATAREGASLAADTAPAPAELRAAQVDRVAVSSPVPHEPRSASTPEALSASLTAQRAQAVYGRAEAQKPLAEPAAADPSSQNSIAPTPGVERSAYQAPPTASTPQTPPNVARPAAPRAIDPRHQRGPATPAGVPTASVTTPSLTIATPSASAVSAAVSAQTGDEPSSQQDAAARSTRSAHQGGAAADAVADMPNLAPSFRQGTDAGALGTATPASSRAREASVAAPPPVAPKLTGTSAIAIAAFQAAAAAAAVDTELVTGSAQTPSARVLDQELPSQIVQAIRLRADNGNGQVHMRLNPDYLGEVSVDVRMNGASVVASVHASSAEVRDWLRTNEMQLRQTLADQGLHLQELVVSDEEPSEREGSGQRYQPSDEQAQERRARRPRETATFEVLL
ncbi:MAG: flagellar hook-length control protein FliK [Vicinamibacterales bacterium]